MKRVPKKRVPKKRVPKKDRDRDAYSALCAKVAVLDTDAARYLRTKAPKLGSFDYEGNLDSCFRWADTPQGVDYWRDLAAAVGANKDRAHKALGALAPGEITFIEPGVPLTPKRETDPETILQEAQRLVHGDRGADYGHPIDDFQCTADMWSAYLKHKYAVTAKLEPEDVGLMMVCVKLSREAERHKRDNLTDAAGYCETVSMIKDERKRRGAEK